VASKKLDIRSILEKSCSRSILLPIEPISQTRLAKGLGISPRRVKTRSSWETRHHRGHGPPFWRGTSACPPQFWLGLQMDYELDVEMDRLGDRLETGCGSISQGRLIAGRRDGSRRGTVKESTIANFHCFRGRCHSALHQRMRPARLAHGASARAKFRFSVLTEPQAHNENPKTSYSYLGGQSRTGRRRAGTTG